MKIEDYYVPSGLNKLNTTVAFFAKELPNIGKYAIKHGADFRGLTMFRGDAGDVVVGFRIWGDDGSPLVTWSSGDDFPTAITNLDKALRDPKWRPDPPKT